MPNYKVIVRIETEEMRAEGAHIEEQYTVKRAATPTLAYAFVYRAVSARHMAAGQNPRIVEISTRRI